MPHSGFHFACKLEMCISLAITIKFGDDFYIFSKEVKSNCTYLYLVYKLNT